jgi:endonuclease/exonuclease/phosphatase family metal-dependent hydrolase
MDLTIGTFNLNNLFSRWNFQAEIPKGTILEEVMVFDAASERKLRTFKGRVVRKKDPKDTTAIADRVKAMDLDILAVQEAENIEALRTFNSDALGGMYPHVILVEGNDPRLIDVGVLSRYPIGQVVSHQTEPDPISPVRPLFGRDLLRVDILNPSRTKRLFTVFNSHLKSNFIDPLEHRTEAQKEAARVRNNERRQRQAEATRRIIEDETRPNSKYVVLGDMNDDPDSEFLAPLLQGRLKLVDALVEVEETRDSKPETLGSQPGPRWTSRYKKSGLPPEHRLFDQIWVSPQLKTRVDRSFIDRRTKHGGNGSDHDPAWVTLRDL